ncbi:UNKNOWN [Stylonychia lemnae]|uniref:Uncharacterized protein n=1 Tax=Stylonychia lemnae TaxID=5949 RepID=A0A078A5P7_STYLE|nr:UNKNOWN [Stylonychia lemnae]|eukprot:CDW77570.1 UNKNOWN [Stylonychia lemnae]
MKQVSPTYAQSPPYGLYGKIQNNIEKLTEEPASQQKISAIKRGGNLILSKKCFKQNFSMPWVHPKIDLSFPDIKVLNIEKYAQKPQSKYQNTKENLFPIQRTQSTQEFYDNNKQSQNVINRNPNFTKSEIEASSSYQSRQQAREYKSRYGKSQLDFSQMFYNTSSMPEVGKNKNMSSTLPRNKQIIMQSFKNLQNKTQLASPDRIVSQTNVQSQDNLNNLIVSSEIRSSMMKAFMQRRAQKNLHIQKNQLNYPISQNNQQGSRVQTQEFVPFKQLKDQIRSQTIKMVAISPKNIQI